MRVAQAGYLRLRRAASQSSSEGGKQAGAFVWSWVTGPWPAWVMLMSMSMYVQGTCPVWLKPRAAGGCSGVKECRLGRAAQAVRGEECGLMVLAASLLAAKLRGEEGEGGEREVVDSQRGSQSRWAKARVGTALESLSREAACEATYCLPHQLRASGRRHAEVCRDKAYAN